jgi:hypothetical protein
MERSMPSKLWNMIVPLIFTLLTIGTAKAEVINLFSENAPQVFRNASRDVWHASFEVKEDVDLVGLGLIFDPSFTLTTPSLHLMLWDGVIDQNTTNDDRLGLMQVLIGFDDIPTSTPISGGLAPYLFSFATETAFPNPASIRLLRGKIYTYSAQVNIAASWVMNTDQNYPFNTADGLMTVLDSGVGYAGTGLFAPPLFLDVRRVPEPATWSLLVLAVIPLLKSRRKSSAI